MKKKKFNPVFRFNRTIIRTKKLTKSSLEGTKIYFSIDFNSINANFQRVFLFKKNLFFFVELLTLLLIQLYTTAFKRRVSNQGRNSILKDDVGCGSCDTICANQIRRCHFFLNTHVVVFHHSANEI